MRRLLRICAALLLALLALLPVCMTVAACFGYRFRLGSYPAFAALLAVLSIVCAAVAFSLRREAAPVFRKFAALPAVVLPLAVLDALLVFLPCRTALVGGCVLLCVLACFVFTACGTPSAAPRVVSLLLSGVLTVFAGGAAAFAAVFGNFARNTVVRALTSPDGAYIAEIISSDQGALGGDTFVEVRKNRGVITPLFSVTPGRGQRVYSGDWGAQRDLEVRWTDNGDLLVNGQVCTFARP